MDSAAPHLQHVDLRPPNPAPRPTPVPMVTASPPGCPELDLSLPLSPAPPPVLLPRGGGRRQVRFKSKEPVVMVIAPPGNPKGRGRCHGGAPSRRAGPAAKAANPTALFEERGAALPEGAELNTTLALRAELEEVAGAEFNSQKAVQEQLKSTRTKNSINNKATEGVNVPPSQQLYRALISVSVEEELTIRQACDRLPLAPPTRITGNKREAGPDLQVFIRADQLREKPLLPGEELSMPRPQPATRPAHSTFDLYHRHTRWEAGP